MLQVMLASVTNRALPVTFILIVIELLNSSSTTWSDNPEPTNWALLMPAFATRLKVSLFRYRSPLFMLRSSRTRFGPN